MTQAELRINFNNAKYGQMVEYTDPVTGATINSVKIWFFNGKGAFIGNTYKFVPYNTLQKRRDGYHWQTNYGHFMRITCNLITILIRWTQYKNMNL